MLTNFNNLSDFYSFMEFPTPRNKDFEVGKLEDIQLDKITKVTPFRHRLYSICLIQQLDIEFNIGYYKSKPKLPCLLFKSPYQIMSWQLQLGIKKGWYFIFTEDFILKYPQLINLLYEFPFLQIDKAIPLTIEERELTSLIDIFEHINNEYETNSFDRFDIISSYVHVLMVHIRRLYDKSVQEERELILMTRESDLSLFNKFKKLLDKQDCTEEVMDESSRTVNYSAKKLNIHPNYLNAVVKRITGNTAVNLIHNHIIAIAKTLLMHTNLSVKEISFRLSFNEPTHFGTFFKKYVAQTPMEFRREHQF